MNLFWCMDDNFGAALVRSNTALNFNLPAFQRSQVAEFIFVGRKNNAGKGAVLIILAEIQETVSSPRSENAQQPAGDATRCTHVRSRLLKIHAAACGRSIPTGGRCHSSESRPHPSHPQAIRHQRAERASHQNNSRHPGDLLYLHLAPSKTRTAILPPHFPAEQPASAKPALARWARKVSMASAFRACRRAPLKYIKAN